MYCPINEREQNSLVCQTICCRLYNLALAFLAVLILATLGLILGSVFAVTLLPALPILIAVAVILAIIFIVTLLTRGCCNYARRQEYE